MAARVYHPETGPLSYVIKLSDGRSICRHHDHVRISQDNIPNDNIFIGDVQKNPARWRSLI